MKEEEIDEVIMSTARFELPMMIHVGGVYGMNLKNGLEGSKVGCLFPNWTLQDCVYISILVTSLYWLRIVVCHGI